MQPSPHQPTGSLAPVSGDVRKARVLGAPEFVNTMVATPATTPMPQDSEDARLVARCKDGDGAAWGLLVQRYQRLVYAIVRRIGLDEHAAADVFQTVFVRLMEHLPRIADPSRLQAWIVTTAKREALLQLKRGRRTVSMTRLDESGDDGSSEWDQADETPIAEDALENLQLLNGVRNGLDKLDPRCRELLLMLFSDEDERLSYDDVAQRLGTSVGSIGPTRSRCLDKLRKLVN